jgi:hypothetical protein
VPVILFVTYEQGQDCKKGQGISKTFPYKPVQTAWFHFNGSLLQSFIETKHPCDNHNSCAGKQISSTFICICCSVFGFTTTMHMQHASSAEQMYTNVFHRVFETSPKHAVISGISRIPNPELQTHTKTIKNP